MKWITVSILGLIAAALLVVVLSPHLRDRVQSYFAPVGYKVLATAQGDLLNDGSTVKVVKYESEEGIAVEILKVDPKTSQEHLVDRVILPDKHDGFFNFHGHVTRLAIADVAHDGKMELLAPTFDNQLVPHLNVLRYNPITKRFEMYKPAP